MFTSRLRRAVAPWALPVILLLVGCSSGNGARAAAPTPDAGRSTDAGTGITPDAGVEAESGSKGGADALPVFAFEAPDSLTQTTYFDDFTKGVLPHIAGPGFTIAWSAVEHCSQTAPCEAEATYDWAAVDTNIKNYVRNPSTPFDTGCGGHACRIILIVQSTSDSGNINDATPAYLFSQEYASSVGADAPQDVVICNNTQGGSIHLGGKTVPAPITSTRNWSEPEFAAWNVASGALLTSPTDLAITGTFPTSNFSGFPVVYEMPFRLAYQHFIRDLLKHYSSAGSGDGPMIAPYIAYIRFGMSEGGENLQQCGTAGSVPVPSWTKSMAYPAGYLARPSHDENPGDFVYVSLGAGKSASSPPAWCQTATCITGADGSIVGWRNTGAAPEEGATGNAMWPGIRGQAIEPHGFTYNGYLGEWENGDGAGYMTEMVNFITAQASSIPSDVASHNGMPFNGNWAMADSEAILAAGAGIGFGMEGLSLRDLLSYEEKAVPSTSSDWLVNFDAFANRSIVRHLQTAWPGGGVAGTQSEEFPISEIIVDVSGTATVHCGSGCQTFCGTTKDGGLAYVSGSANTALDGPWKNITCDADDNPTFPAGGAVKAGTYASGGLYSIDYLPGMIPFARAHHATSLELHECSFDYAFGTTTSPRCTGGKGPDVSYGAAIEGH
jgi:hypothetical protein